MTAAAAFALLLRCVSIAEPLGIDQSLWASAVRGMSRGQLLYRDVWEQRPPGIYWIYLAGFNAFGWTPAAVAWLDVLAAASTAVLLALVGRTLAGPATGALAAAMYTVLTMPAWLYGHGGFLERSVCETFIAVAVSLGAWAAAGVRATGSMPAAAVLGLAAGAAVVLKPNAGLYFPALLSWIVLYRPEPIARSAGAIGAAIAASAVVPLIALGWLWQLGLLHDAKVAVVDFNRYYVGQGFSPAAYALEFSKAVWLRMKTDPLWACGAIAALVAVADLLRRRTLPPLAGLAVIWGGAAVLVIVVNGARLFNSYFIQALPPLALLGAWLLTEAARESRPRRAIAAAAAIVMAVLLVQRDYPARVFGWAAADFAALRGSMDWTAHLERFGGYANARGYSARANAELADYIRARTTPEDRIFLFGINGAGVYFASDRLVAQRFLRVNFFVATDFPDPAFRLDSVIAELVERRPVYVVFERLNARSEMGRAVDRMEADPSVAVLLRGYRKETQIEDFSIYRRAD
ncbi:MAG TPA: hypothetical protein VFK57_19345 [Vicinamibacterales bacterium]|nr:hypothetical protein [Vicinamibacterales bacterium]